MSGAEHLEVIERRLRETVERATAGTWYHSTFVLDDKPSCECVTYGPFAQTRMYQRIAEIDVDNEGDFGALSPEQCAANMDHIAAACPDNLRVVLAEVDRLRAELDNPAYQYAGSRIQRAAIEYRNAEMDRLRQRVERLAAELNQVRAATGMVAHADAKSCAAAGCGCWDASAGELVAALREDRDRLRPLEAAAQRWVEALQGNPDDTETEARRALYEVAAALDRAGGAGA